MIKGKEIGIHASCGDALVIALDGQGQITIDDTSYILNAGDSIIMPAQHPHSVFAKEQVQNVSCGGISIVLNKSYKNIFYCPTSGNVV